MYDGFGIAPYTFLICLCVQPRFIEIYGSSGSAVSFLEGATLRQIYSMPATIRMVYRDRYVVLTRTFKRITHTGSMVRLPFHKGYCGEPTHHIGVSNLSRLLYQQTAKPLTGSSRPRRSGPNYYLPSPRRASFFTSAAGHTPTAAAIYFPFLSRLQSASTAAFFIQEHLTIRNWQCQHITKINRITVYPFII